MQHRAIHRLGMGTPVTLYERITTGTR
jgi:hypothetical protein